MFARLGGDEFALILVDGDTCLAEEVCDRVTKAVAALDFVFDKAYRIDASIGVKAIAKNAQSVFKLMSAADKACYEAKSRGKGPKWVSADRAAA
jgi:diguanylate cyclase